MNTLILLAALTAGQCEDGVCKVEVTAVVQHAHGQACGGTCHAGPVRRLVHAKPLRRVGARILQRRLVRRTLGWLFCRRGCR